MRWCDVLGFCFVGEIRSCVVIREFRIIYDFFFVSSCDFMLSGIYVFSLPIFFSHHALL